MEYCAPLGIPHSEFMGWNDDDRNKALSYVAWKKKFCSKCGTDPDEWMDEDGKFAEPPPYEAVTNVCYGCATLEEERAGMDKEVATSTRYHTFLRRYRGSVEQWQMSRSQLD